MSTAREWRKSSYSNAESQCVEVSIGLGDVGFRDTKNREGGSLWFSGKQHRLFLGAIKKEAD
jgi:hypothetical protein